MAITRTIKTTRDDHLIAALAALAITVHIAESALPSPLPGIKPGLANVVTLLVLCRYGWQMAVWVTLLRVLVGSILIGTFLSPAFFLSAHFLCVQKITGRVATTVFLGNRSIRAGFGCCYGTYERAILGCLQPVCASPGNFGPVSCAAGIGFCTGYYQWVIDPHRADAVE
jgi:hypothetical protein